MGQMMRNALKRPAIRVGLAIVLAMIVALAGLGVYTQVTAFSYQDLLTALSAKGTTIHVNGTASSVLFRGAGHDLTLNGAPIQAYEYQNTLAAQVDVVSLSPDGTTYRPYFGPFGGPAVSVDWIAPPHHYHRGRVIVTYVVNDAAITSLLTSVLGPQFAGGTVPSGSGYQWFLDRLRATGASVSLMRNRPNSPVLAGTDPATDARDIRVNGAFVSVFEFADVQAAARYASHIVGGNYADPAAHRFLIIDYADPPHFYRADNVIVIYVGADLNTLRLLASVLGPPFT